MLVTVYLSTNHCSWDSLCLAENIWSAIDPAVPVSNGLAQLHKWATDNEKAYSLLYLILSPEVQRKVDNVGVMRSGRLLWAQLASFYTTSNPANRSMPTSQLHAILHDISKPADDVLQSSSSAENSLTAITGPSSIVPDKTLSGKGTDLQRNDSVINATGVALSKGPTHGGVGSEAPKAYAALGNSGLFDVVSMHFAANKEFDGRTAKDSTDLRDIRRIENDIEAEHIQLNPDVST
ncbi:hypothetical protein B0H14DRAFT_3465676 [Mycena olivaceomarginata]|nr:hypothetical protein B0H14DRAFT_3465676 [Mycena olivaceomarginata]